MAKQVTEAATYTLRKEYTRLAPKRHLVACDDGSLYVFENTDGARWRTLARVDSDGSKSVEPSRLPACIEAHMDGFTQSGPHGVDSDEYWV